MKAPRLIIICTFVSRCARTVLGEGPHRVDENEYLQLFSSALDSLNFYFSYNYDVTHNWQRYQGLSLHLFLSLSRSCSCSSTCTSFCPVSLCVYVLRYCVYYICVSENMRVHVRALLCVYSCFFFHVCVIRNVWERVGVCACATQKSDTIPS